ncbi:hypothetical protein RhiirA5_428275 [Rhizophagus irregularis]|uniref:Uncharacterized protein n=1 Tax=Rhizophagus irregularis TaxID=588596 RepID=A0A2N0P0L2_9GLOM|nr:hypothetical protein RhiirA5_428275 [Rhizophagus irregularis]PKC62889.1 hypothetical protein RhiirA1_464526 [Rhizophagus irregularis]
MNKKDDKIKNLKISSFSFVAGNFKTVRENKQHALLIKVSDVVLKDDSLEVKQGMEDILS